MSVYSIIPKSYKLIFLLFILSVVACNPKSTKGDYKKGSYGYDVCFFKSQQIEMIQLKNEISGAAVLISPDYQGRVMTSSAEGMTGNSFGWINHDYIKAGDINTQFNPFGGEERFWLGPEGGPYSVYFDKGADQTFQNWRVPKELDTAPFDVLEKSNHKVSFQKAFELSNASGSVLKVGVERTITLLTKSKIEQVLKTQINESLSYVAYETENTLINRGNNNWTEDSGFLSIWLLCMFNPAENGVVFLPYQKGENEEKGKIVEDNYFGKVPQERLIAKNGVVYFKVDGKFRSKIGLSPQRATPYSGSYDPDKKTLTILWYSKPDEARRYVNSKWGKQENPLIGDVLNSYNDGPVEDGSMMGPFYEIESSSPAALLNSGERIKHTQRIFHITGERKLLSQITMNLFNLSLKEVEIAFDEHK